MEREHEEYVIKQGPGKGGVAPMKTEVVELGGENNEVQKSTIGTDDGESKTDSATSR